MPSNSRAGRHAPCLPSVAVAATLRTVTEQLERQEADLLSGFPQWIWHPASRNAPDVRLFATGHEESVHVLGQIAELSQRQVIGCTDRVVGWPPAPVTFDISAIPNARQVEDHTILRGVDPRWFSITSTPRDTFNIASSIPLNVRVVDRRILAITERDDVTHRAHRMLVTTAKNAVLEAERYLDSLMATSVPLQPNWRDPSIRLTRRQLQILRLIAGDLTDERIAKELQLSQRQIRAEISALYQVFNVHSRFGLGLAYGSWAAGSSAEV
ncbi:helix-turn-helix transcriptional regulator [Microlunatus elymi]|nr:LuxR C-terminal-related transcriptional regulator [Microlunatus elymi]